MTQVSRRYLSPSVQKRMYEILIKGVSKARYGDDIVNFLTDLLSPTERIMLAKRLAIAYLLIKGNYTQREISQVLKVSLTTIQKVSLALNIKGECYRKIINSLRREEKIEAFMNGIADILNSVPPPKRDWGTWQRSKNEEQIKRRKAF